MSLYKSASILWEIQSALSIVRASSAIVPARALSYCAVARSQLHVTCAITYAALHLLDYLCNISYVVLLSLFMMLTLHN